MATSDTAMATGMGLSTYAYVGDPVIALWSRRRQRSQDLKQIYENDWAKYWRWYKAQVEPLGDPVDWWRSNDVIPTVFKIIETLLPRHVMGVFDQHEWFTVEARQRRDEGYERMVEQLLRASVEGMQLFPKLYEAMKYATIMGHCWAKVVWREDYTTRQVLNPVSEVDPMTGQTIEGVEAEVVTEEEFNGVDFEWRPLDRVFPDPTGENRWFIEEIDTTIEQLAEAQDNMKGELYDREEFARLMAGIPPARGVLQYGGGDSLADARSGTSGAVSVEYAREPQSTEGIPNEYVSPMRDGIGVKLWQCWGWVPPALRGKDKAAWRLTVLAEGKYVLRNEPSPTPDGKPPYFALKSIPIPGRLYGESIIKYIGPLQDQQTAIANMRVDEVKLGVWQQFLYKKGALMGDNLMLMQPGGAIPVMPDPGMDVQSVFGVLPRPTVLPEHYQEDQYRQLQAEHAAAASDIMQGVSSSDRQTATEVERKVQQGNARHMLQVLWNDYTIKKELLSRTWRWLQMRLTKPKFIRTVGEEYAQVSYRDIQIPIDIIVGGGLNALSKESRLQMTQELLQLSSSPAFAMWMKPGPILRRYMQDVGWKNPEAFIKTDQEVMLEQMLAMAGQGAAMGQGAGGAAEGAQGPEAEGAESGTGAPPSATGDGDTAPSAQGMSGVQGPGGAASMAGEASADAGRAGQ